MSCSLLPPRAALRSPANSSIRNRNSADESVLPCTIPVINNEIDSVMSPAVRTIRGNMNFIRLLIRLIGNPYFVSLSISNCLITRSYSFAKSSTASIYTTLYSIISAISRAECSVLIFLWNPNFIRSVLMTCSSFAVTDFSITLRMFESIHKG